MSKFKSEDYGGAGGSFAGMSVGETRTVTFHPKGRDPITKTITRTNRPFMCDWVDSSNMELQNTRPPTTMRWVFPEGYGCPPQLRDLRYYGGEQ